MLLLLNFFLFFGIPIILITLFCVYLNRYTYAKKVSKTFPDKFPESTIKKFKILTIVFGSLAAILVSIVIYFIYTLTTAISFM